MKKFKTESKKLLDLMINSIYTNKEIFLRELISNASDAVDKLYFRSLTDKKAKVSKEDLSILVAFDAQARTVSVSDNGIGMTKDELDKNLGTIAHSDSQEFKTTNDSAQGEDIDIIGQFGVGFYSSFMVASKVRVVSRAFGSDEAWAWESNGVDGYTIEPATRETHGTDIILTIKENTTGTKEGEDAENYDSFLSEYGLKSLIKRYSNYVRYPVKMNVSKTREKPKPEDAGDDYKPDYETYTELETINSMIPIWKRKKSEVKQEEYNEFYKSNFHDFADPARTISLHAEGALSYDALLFIPSKTPYDLYSKDFKKGLALYSSNVLIMDKCEELLPDYFNFVRGVVDSQDLTLNISRETLQHNSQLKAIARRIEKKVKSDLENMRDNDREAYEEFFANFGRALKYGIYSSYGMAKDTLADLLLFYSAKEKKMITLAEYAAAAKAAGGAGVTGAGAASGKDGGGAGAGAGEQAAAGADAGTQASDQGSIYYAAGESIERLAKMPVVKAVLDRGHDVLLCTQEVDEFCITAMADYAVADANDADSLTAWPFKNVAGGDLGLETEEEKKQAEEETEKNKELFDAMKEALGNKVEKVEVSTRLTDAPACITAAGPLSLEMEKILSGMPGAEGDPAMKTERVLELNAKHKVFASLQAAQKKGDAEKVKLYTEILYNQALLVEGLPIEDPVAYAQAVTMLMK